MHFFFVDPFELQNRVNHLKPEERSYLHHQLKALIACKGRSCTVSNNLHAHGVQKSRANVLPQLPQPQRYRKRKPVDEYGNGTCLLYIYLVADFKVGKRKVENRKFTVAILNLYSS